MSKINTLKISEHSDTEVSIGNKTYCFIVKVLDEKLNEVKILKDKNIFNVSNVLRTFSLPQTKSKNSKYVQDIFEFLEKTEFSNLKIGENKNICLIKCRKNNKIFYFSLNIFIKSYNSLSSILD